ncbi:PAS domain-containing protein [Deinococcus peraridilitoris]|uniref:PAS domain-containing protein n=1 Tax=Deinococcus peraridilitoris TaxID=432329 RepID=UPI0002E33330|nr:PAS domain-containing protein [Deinococcus peraridilitoris]
MARCIHALDWTRTPLGHPQTWPQTLCTTLDIMLASSFPMLVLWGHDLVQLYNDGYRDLMGAKHPSGLGQPTHDCWPESRHFTAGIFQGVLERGESYEFVDQHLVLQRNGNDEDTYFTLNYSPIRDAGAVGGALLLVTETTRHVLTQRQLHEQHAELQVRTKALANFAELSRELAFETDRYALVRRTQEIVLHLLPPGTACTTNSKITCGS